MIRRGRRIVFGYGLFIFFMQQRANLMSLHQPKTKLLPSPAEMHSILHES